MPQHLRLTSSLRFNFDRYDLTQKTTRRSIRHQDDVSAHFVSVLTPPNTLPQTQVKVSYLNLTQTLISQTLPLLLHWQTATLNNLKFTEKK